MSYTKVSFKLGEEEVVLETGKVARQATGAVMASCGGTIVLCTVVADRNPSENRDFFPLTVNYQEKMYAAGRIPGGFLKREARPTEKETLTSRLIDRPIRPLFPKGFLHEVQVIANVLSVDKDINPDILAMIGCSAALSISGIPFAGPIGANRVGFKDDIYVLNPTVAATEEGELNMVVAGTQSSVLMVESEAKELSEDMMLGAVLFAHQEMQPQIAAIEELCQKAGNEPWEIKSPEKDEATIEKLSNAYRSSISEAYAITDKLARLSKLKEIQETAVNEIDDSEAKDDVVEIIKSLEKDVVRKRVLAGESRIDGRTRTDVRPLLVEVGVLPQTHGSALFQRGETQAIVVTTLGASRDSALIETLEGTSYDTFFLHYNFPPFSVGEAGRLGPPGRREIGHGRLARRALSAVLPDEEEFPYTIRVVSEITESNGSSSMASVCGASLALMDGGVPIKSQVAGVAMGLVIEGDDWAVLTDILGDEDHLGDMDFKVAGTSDGITALQMDIKVAGITEAIMEVALNQAHDARMHILAKMNEVIASPRPELAETAPSITQMMIHPDKIRDVIGKGGTTIRAIQDASGAVLEVDDDGVLKIFATDQESARIAREQVEEIVAEIEIGQIYVGKVTGIRDFGAFVELKPGKQALVHISQIARKPVQSVRDHVEMGQQVKVKVTDIGQKGISASMRAVPKEDEEEVANL